MPDVDTPPSILSKAFDLLRAFNSNERVMSLTELSEERSREIDRASTARQAR